MIFPRRWKSSVVFKTNVGKVSGSSSNFDIEDLRKASGDDIIGNIEPGNFLGNGACELAFKLAYKSTFAYEKVVTIVLQEE